MSLLEKIVCTLSLNVWWCVHGTGAVNTVSLFWRGLYGYVSFGEDCMYMPLLEKILYTCTSVMYMYISSFLRQAYTYMYIHMYKCTYSCTYVFIHIRRYIYIYIYVCVCIYIHVYTCTYISFWRLSSLRRNWSAAAHYRCTVTNIDAPWQRSKDNTRSPDQSDVYSDDRVGYVVKTTTGTRISESQDGHLPWNKGRKRVQFQWICTGLDVMSWRPHG